LQNELKPTKVVRSRVAKQMIVSSIIPDMWQPWLQRTEVNTVLYISIYLPEIMNELLRINRNRHITSHHDNANFYTVRQTVDFLFSNNAELMTYCPYSYDLSSNDFFLFPSIKNKMRGERFESLK